MAVKIKGQGQNIITLGAPLHISAKLQHFLINSFFSVIARTHTDKTENNILLCRFADAHDITKLVKQWTLINSI